MSTYLVDYENVNAGGMTGLEALSASDRVFLFYSSSSNTLTFNLYQSLNNTKAKVELMQVATGGKNSLDFQLVSYLGYLVAKKEDEEYVVVSRDNGFANAVSFWTDRHIRAMLANNLRKESRKAVENELAGVLPADLRGEGEKISQLIEKYKTKQGINNALVKMYGSDTGTVIYKAIRPMLSDKKAK